MSEVVEPVAEPVAEPTVLDTPAVEPVAEPAGANYSAYIKEDGTFTDDFYANLPDDLGSHSSLKQIKSIEDLSKSYVNTKSLVGKKLEEFWTSEDEGIVAKRKEIMGIPDSADGYEIAVPELPDGVPYNEAQLNDFKNIASELGITQEQAAKLVEWDSGRAVKAFEGITEQMQTQTKQAEDSLRKEWGSKFEYNISKVQQATDHLGITETINELGLGRSPEFLTAMLEKIVPAISDDKLIETAQRDSLATVEDTLNDLDTQMLTFEGSTRSPEYQTLVKKRGELLAKISRK